MISPDAASVELPHSGSLQILRAKPEDAGVYRYSATCIGSLFGHLGVCRCKVSSEDKYRESTEGRLTVKSPDGKHFSYLAHWVILTDSLARSVESGGPVQGHRCGRPNDIRQSMHSIVLTGPWLQSYRSPTRRSSRRSRPQRW